MRIEITLLGATLILALIQIMLAGQVRTMQYGTKWNTGARDAEMPPLNPLAGRLVRAQANLFETLPIFIGAVLAAAFANKLGELTAIGAALYFGGRVLYVPLYAAGIPIVRSIVWMVASVGLVLILWALMFG
ncbi:MAPEG family protein [Sphingomonas sp. BIUV-7]|uniref:MAPEG family protein n=1 Tax=Sphingomonas natans TaxID=3063330 RepID=A0ABT8YF03_9SPHN|nr:MAPEG family protein [Sphingomonas sp. BIUV-7]MDO6416912.1 MAPEG family protein [Sphingomonas sp. BIUV-7]